VSGRHLLRGLLSDLPVKVICLTAAVILFLFHRVNTMTERFFSVPLEVATPPGLAVASAYPKTVRITLRGSEDTIYPILEEDIEAMADLQSRRSQGVFREPVRISRHGTAANVEPLEIKVEPQEVAFTLEPLAERKVNVVADLRGVPAYGFEMIQSSVAPSSVLVRGARSRVQALSSLSTEEIDLSGRAASFSIRTKVIAPSSLVRIVGDASVDFRATIQESVVVRTFDTVPIMGADIPPHLALRTALPLGTMSLQGTQLALDEVRAEQVKLLIDFSAVHKAGQYILHPRPEAPTGFSILDWTPREVTVDLVSSVR
jgi:YbbR domain-containing protein